MLEMKKVHEDKRGAIYTVVGNDIHQFEEFTILVTKQGYARGGCIHKEAHENMVVIEGRILLTVKIPSTWKSLPTDEQYTTVLDTGDNAFVPQNAPHYFVAKEHSVVIEWGPKVSDRNQKDEDMRKVVDTTNGH